MAAEMKITYLPQSDNFEKLKMRYDKNDKFERNQNKQDDNSAKSLMKSNQEKAPHFLLKQPMYDSIDLKMMAEPYKNSSRLKRNSNMNQIGEGNDSIKLPKYEPEVNETSEGLLNIIQKDTDSFYDNELFRKVSDNDGNLPNGLKLIVPPDKEPLLVYNISEDTLTREELEKRKKRSMQTNIDDDYFYYEEKLQDSSKPIFVEDNVKQKSSSGNLIDRPLKNSDFNGNIAISDTASVSIVTNAKPIPSTVIPVEDKIFVEPLTIEKTKDKPSGNWNFKDTMVKMTDGFNNKLIYAAKGKGSQKPRPGSGQSCHPSGGLPKNPGIPPLPKKGRDAEYEKLLKGDTSEKVVKATLDKLNTNSQMSSELGICSFDIAELRSLFKQIRSSEKKECCTKLRGEFKCFLNWLLTVEPSRKKRSNMMPDKTDVLGTCNSQFPKFDIMGGGDYYRPSYQYENLAHKVEEYADVENKL